MPKERVSDGSQHRKVLAMGPAQVKVVRFVDGECNDEVRLSVKVGGEYYLLREKVGNSMLLQRCSDWLQDGMTQYKQGGQAAPEGPSVKAAKSK